MCNEECAALYKLDPTGPRQPRSANMKRNRRAARGPVPVASEVAEDDSEEKGFTNEALSEKEPHAQALFEWSCLVRHQSYEDSSNARVSGK